MAQQSKHIQIEFPSRGATYCRQEWGVYAYDVYPRNSVLSGQTRRTFKDSFKTKEEAVVAYPEAQITGCCFAPPDLSHLPEEDY